MPRKPALPNPRLTQPPLARGPGYWMLVPLVRGGPPMRAPEKIVKLWSAGSVGDDHLAVENGVLDVQERRHLLAECLEAAQLLAVARDQPAAVPLEITKPPEAVVLELKEPPGIVERLLPRGWE